MTKYYNRKCTTRPGAQGTAIASPGMPDGTVRGSAAVSATKMRLAAPVTRTPQANPKGERQVPN